MVAGKRVTRVIMPSVECWCTLKIDFAFITLYFQDFNHSCGIVGTIVKIWFGQGLNSLYYSSSDYGQEAKKLHNQTGRRVIIIASLTI